MAEQGDIVKYIRVGVQDRPPKYGRGDTKRVMEITLGDYSFGINLGDIAQAPSDAVMCPTTPWLEIGGGAVENRLASVMREEILNLNSIAVQQYIENVLKTQGVKRAFAARELADYLQKSIGLQVSGTPEQIADDIITSAHLSNRERIEGHIELEHGAAVPIPSGKLKKSGIDAVILVNVTPEGRSMTTDDMSRFTSNACRIANLTGAQSITLPAVGTGFAAAVGFGLSQEDSLKGFFHGAMSFAKEAGLQAKLKKIDYNIYAQANEVNAQSVAQLIRNLRVR